MSWSEAPSGDCWTWTGPIALLDTYLTRETAGPAACWRLTCPALGLRALRVAPATALPGQAQTSAEATMRHRCGRYLEALGVPVWGQLEGTW